MRSSTGGAANTGILLSGTETTLYSPGWSTFGVNTFWSFFNNTDATINGTLTILNTAGATVTTVSQAIPTGQAFFPSTLTLGIAANQSGTARFTNDGPPGAIQAEGVITNFAGYLQRVNFEPRRRQ